MKEWEGFCDGAVFGILVDSFDLMLINIPHLPASSLTVMFCNFVVELARTFF